MYFGKGKQRLWVLNVINDDFSYECINGVLETSAIKKAVLSNGLCCGVMSGAVLTDSYFPHKQLAEKGCRQQDKQLCQVI